MSHNVQAAWKGTLAAVLIAGCVAWAGSDGSTEVGSIPVFALCGALAFAINWAVFVPSNIAQTEHYFDLTGSVTYVTVTAAALAFSDGIDARAVAVATMVVVWAARLGTFLFRRVKRDGRDGRFDKLKVNPGLFFRTWTLQGLWVLFTMACALAVITGAEREPFGAFAIVGTATWAVGFGIEALADHQKSVFKRDSANKERFISTGLWAWSRHPNYFGEILLWAGIAVVAIPVLSGWRWVTLVSPLFVYVLLTRISGVPLLERRGMKRWGDDPAYQEYVRTTPALMMKPPR